jgi:hypothetical protein
LGVTDAFEPTLEPGGRSQQVGQLIFGGTTEIMKEIIGRGLGL